jgi:segregation and condensation protein B
METKELVNIIEAALLASSNPVSMDKLLGLFPEEAKPERQELRNALDALSEACAERGIELREVNSGYRLQVKEQYAPWVSKLWEERPPRYSRALLETLALIAYKQPITRAEIEEVRGVAVSTNIMKTLQEREWVRVVGHRDVPGRPALYATTREFLDYFNLKGLDELPSLAEIRDIESINAELDLEEQFATTQSETDISEPASEPASEETADLQEADSARREVKMMASQSEDERENTAISEPIEESR